MKNIAPSLICFLTVSSLFAASPTHLDMSDSGRISIRTDDLGEIQIRVDVVETSGGVWKSVRSADGFQPEVGEEVTRSGNYEFPDGAVVVHTTRAKIDGETVSVRSEWPTDSSAPGFARVDLWISEEIASDLTIESGGEAVTTDMDERGTIQGMGAIIFRRTSDQEFLFRIDGELLNASVFFLSERKNEGLTVRLGSVPNPNDSTIGDSPELEWTLSFTE